MCVCACPLRPSAMPQRWSSPAKSLSPGVPRGLPLCRRNTESSPGDEGGGAPSAVLPGLCVCMCTCDRDSHLSPRGAANCRNREKVGTAPAARTREAAPLELSSQALPVTGPAGFFPAPQAGSRSWSLRRESCPQGPVSRCQWELLGHRQEPGKAFRG